MVFSVKFGEVADAAATGTIAVNYATSDGTATAGEDYMHPRPMVA